MQYRIEITSFGRLHGEFTEQAELIVDLRGLFLDPHLDPAMRDLTGLDSAVYDNVMKQPGAWPFVRGLADTAYARAEIEPVHFAIGCSGGRHRGPAVALAIRAMLWNTAIVFVGHRDIKKPVVSHGR